MYFRASSWGCELAEDTHILLPNSSVELAMPTAPVDNTGTVLYYEDSGAPAGSTDYVTLVLIHGTCFHGGMCTVILAATVL